MSNEVSQTDGPKETARIESFSDGVFAIAITLLVLEIHVPEVKPGATLFSSLAHEWASLVALLVGFFTILICWINHHYMFQLIHRSNSILLLLNGLKLLVVTLTPFATAVLSKNIQTEWFQDSVNVFCFNFSLMGGSMMLLWLYATKMNFIRGASSQVISAACKLYIFAGVISTSIWLVSLISITACLTLSAIMFMIFLFPKQVVKWWASKLA